MPRPCSLVGLLLLSATLTFAQYIQFQPRIDYPVGASPFSVAVGDFNGDHHPDLAVAGSDANTISILLGNGDGTFQPRVDYGTGTRPASVIAADLNHDGKLDLAVTNCTANAITILLGNEDGSFHQQAVYPTDTNPQWLVAADFNGDSVLDIATANYGPDYYGGSVSVFLGNGDGTFQGPVNVG